jgi:transcriptional regulator with XRE-family HTH domain
LSHRIVTWNPKNSNPSVTAVTLVFPGITRVQSSDRGVLPAQSHLRGLGDSFVGLTDLPVAALADPLCQRRQANAQLVRNPCRLTVYSTFLIVICFSQNEIPQRPRRPRPRQPSEANGLRVELENELSSPGAALRALRQQRGATLKDFSKLTGIAISTLSKLENGKLGMSYEKLLRISRSLGVDLTDLIKEEPRKSGRPDHAAVLGRREITRAGEGPVIRTATYEYQYPSSDIVHKSLNPMFIDVVARSLDEFEHLMRHPGEEFTVVIEGAVDFYCDFYKPTRLELGDSIYFDGNMGHAYVAVLDTPCRVLSVCSAPDEELRGSRDAFPKRGDREAHPSRPARA